MWSEEHTRTKTSCTSVRLLDKKPLKLMMIHILSRTHNEEIKAGEVAFKYFNEVPTLTSYIQQKKKQNQTIYDIR